MRKLIAVFLFLTGAHTHAVINGHQYPFDNEADAARFEVLAEELRCPKCQNQNLADSNAPVAADLRDKVYELMLEGKSDQEIVDYLVARYGDFVRYRPAVQNNTLLLWGGPLIMLVLGGLLVVMVVRRGRKEVSLTENEIQKLNELKRQRSQDGNKNS